MSYPDVHENTEVIAVSNNQFDIKKFIFRLLGFLPWIILSVIICYTISHLYLRYSPKMHKVSAHVLIKDDEENSADYKVLRELGVMPGSKEVQNQIDILESFDLMEAIVDSLKLNIEITTEARISSSPLYGNDAPVFISLVHQDTANFLPATYKLKLYKEKFSIGKGKEIRYYRYRDTIFLNGHFMTFIKNDAVNVADNGYNLIFKNTHTVAMGLRSGIDVRKLHDMGGIIQIGLLDRNPLRAIDIINTLLRAYNTAGIVDKNVVGVKTIQFLKDRIEEVSKELTVLELQKQNFKSNNKISDISTKGADYLNEALGYNKQKIEQTGELELLQSLENYISKSNKFTDIIPSTNGINEPTLTALIQQYNETVLSFQNQAEISTDKDPSIGRLKTSLTEIKGNILKNIESIKNGFQTKLQQLQAVQNNFDKLFTSIPAEEKQLVGLERQIGVKEQLYIYLLQKKEETELALSSNINNTRVVDEAYDEGVVLPKSKQVVSLSVMLGFTIPVVLMLLIDFFNNRITDKTQVESGTNAPVIGEISFDKRKTDHIINPKGRNILTEQLRLIRTNLNYMSADESIQTILVTSFMSGEGKSFISLNLANALAAVNKKVIVVELDLRKPKFSKYLNCDIEHGATDIIVNNIPYQNAIINSPLLNGVDIITAGTIPPDPTEILMSKKLSVLIDELKEDYDHIIIDTSPVGLVADAFALDSFIDIALFVLRHKYSYKTTVKYLDTLYTKKRFKKMGVVINGITDIKGFNYGYGYGYGYYYGDNYYDKDVKTSFVNKLLFKGR